MCIEILPQTAHATAELFAQHQALQEQLADLRLQLWGDPARGSLDESRLPGISGRVGNVAYGHWDTRQMPTETFRTNLELARREFAAFKTGLDAFMDALDQFEEVLEAAGAPYTRGRG